MDRKSLLVAQDTGKGLLPHRKGFLRKCQEKLAAPHHRGRSPAPEGRFYFSPPKTLFLTHAHHIWLNSGTKNTKNIPLKLHTHRASTRLSLGQKS
jgi:hypothetical protein